MAEKTATIGNVLTKLEGHFTEKGRIEKRTDDIVNLIDTSPSEADLIEKFPKKTEEAQDYLIAYLYSKLRDSFSAEGRNYDPDKERRQIIAIHHLLSGNHVHLPTGFGKSSAVLPVTTIVHALTKGENPILTTVNNKLVMDLKSNLEDLINYLPKELKPNIEKVVQEETEMKESFARHFWRSRVSKPKAPVAFLEEKKKPTIFLTDDGALVFETINEPGCWRKLPWVYFDEAHVPFDRGSPYVTVQEEVLTETTKEDYRNKWLLSRIISQLLTDEDFQIEKGAYQLTEEAYQKIEALIKRGFLQEARFTEAISLVAGTTGLDQSLIKEAFINFWQSPYLVLEQKRDLAYGLTADLVAIKNYHLGSEYLFDEKGQLIVRDQYLGWLLSRHHFSPYIHLALSAKDGKFSYTVLEKAAGSVMNFSSFISLVLQGRISATSGTFLFPDLITKKPIPSTFAQFLEKNTDGKIVKVDWQAKAPPAPEIFDNDEGALKAMVKRLKSPPKQPALISCWNEEEGKIMVEILSKEFPGQVRLVGGTTSEEEAELIYEQMEKNDPAARYVISTGKTALGVDIKHPSLRVILFNMPLTRLQVWQALGRRRGEGEDFYWFVAASSLQKFVNYLEPEIPYLKRKLGKLKTFNEIKKELESPDPRQRLLAINYLFTQFEKSLAADTDLIMTFDQFYHQHATKMAYGILEDRLRRKIKEEPDFFELDEFKRKILSSISQSFPPADPRSRYSEEDVTAKLLLQYFIGLPETLYWDMCQELSFIYEAQSAYDLINNKLAYRLVHSLPQELEDWGERRLTDRVIGEFNQIFYFVGEQISEEEKKGFKRSISGPYLAKAGAEGVTGGLAQEEFKLFCQKVLGCLPTQVDFFHPTHVSDKGDFGYVKNKQGRRVTIFRQNGYYYPLINNLNQFIILEESEKIREVVLFPGEKDIFFSFFITWVDNNQL